MMEAGLDEEGGVVPQVARVMVNGVARRVRLESDRSLLVLLREELGLTGAKPGCGEGACGACTVLVDGRPVRACVVSCRDVVGCSVVTVEGLARGGRLHPVQRAFVELAAVQCGYCTPGMVVAAVGLLAVSPDPDDAQIVAALDGNLCRCCAYPRILKAVRRAAGLLSAANGWSLPAPAWAANGPAIDGARHGAPWDMLEPGERDYFSVLADGLAVVLPPGEMPASLSWATDGGAWLHVGADGAVTAFTGKVDLGQGNRTALSLLVAEQLCVPFEAVRLVMGDTDVCPFDIGTFGSRSIPDAGEALRAVAAAARELLVVTAAEGWGVDASRLVAADGRVRWAGDGRSIAYGELVAGVRRVEVIAPERSVMPRLTRERHAAAPPYRAAEVVSGVRSFGSDLTRPGLLHGRILRPPAVGASLRSVDVTRARALPGVTVAVEGSFVGVAAPDAATAGRALGEIDAEWHYDPQPPESELVEHLRSNPIEVEGWGGSFHHEAGDVDAALAAASIRLAATYTTAFIAHAPLETRVALAEWEGDRLTVWVGTQRPFGVREELAAALGVPEVRVRVVVPPTGGGFGGKHTAEAAIEAARLARHAGRPIRLRWSREEEFSHGYLRPAAVIDVASGAGSDGALAAWDFANVNSGCAAILCPYEIPNQRLDFRPAASPLPQGSYRALAATANNFARESHLDELAHEFGADPLEYRLRHLSDDRLAAVLSAAAEHAGWAERSQAAGRGCGIAGGVEKDGRVATCVEVRVGDDRRVAILRIVTAFECGAIVDPDGLVNQIEGATVMGLGGALFEAIHFDAGRILNPSFSQYRAPRFSDVPPIEVVLLDRPDIPSAGAGETPIIAVAPALANAIFAATGARLRSLPLLPDGTVR